MWEEFSFDSDDVQNSKHNVSYEIANEKEVVFDGETCIAKIQNDYLEEIAATNEEIAATKIFKTTSIDDSLPHYSDGDMGSFWFDYQTKLMDRNTPIDIGVGELGSDLFKETTPQEEYNEHLSFEQSNQLFHTWDPSVMATTYDKDPTWDKFPFDPNDVPILEYNGNHEDAAEGANLEEFKGILEHKSDLIMQRADYKKRLSELVEFDSHPGVEQCHQAGDEG